MPACPPTGMRVSRVRIAVGRHGRAAPERRRQRDSVPWRLLAGPPGLSPGGSSSLPVAVDAESGGSDTAPPTAAPAPPARVHNAPGDDQVPQPVGMTQSACFCALPHPAGRFDADAGIEPRRANGRALYARDDILIAVGWVRDGHFAVHAFIGPFSESESRCRR